MYILVIRASWTTYSQAHQGPREESYLWFTALPTAPKRLPLLALCPVGIKSNSKSGRRSPLLIFVSTRGVVVVIVVALACQCSRIDATGKSSPAVSRPLLLSSPLFCFPLCILSTCSDYCHSMPVVAARRKGSPGQQDDNPRCGKRMRSSVPELPQVRQ